MTEMSRPLASHVRLETEDLDEAREGLGRALQPNRLRLTRAGARVRVVHHMAELGATSLHYLEYGADVHASIDEQGFALVQLPLAGRARIRDGAREVVASADVAAVSPAIDAVSLQALSLTPHLLVRLPQELLDSRLAVALGDSPRRPLRFDLAMDLTSGGGRSWRRLIDTIVADLDSGGPISRSPLAAASLERAVADGLLAVHGNSFSDRIRDDGRPTRPRSLRKALSLLEDHAAEPLSTADVAEAVGVSVRSLQEAFRSHLDTTPMAHLRSIRMRRIHAELRTGGPDVTVTDVALRWGVLHLGRFGQGYRRMFGETPSQTLRHGY